MCPLRLILVFLSATLAGFFVLRSLKSGPEDAEETAQAEEESGAATRTQLQGEPLHCKIRSAVSSGFWTCVDMASGRYLWRHLVASPPASASKKSS